MKGNAFWVWGLFFLTGAGVASSGDAKKDQDQLQGTWRAEKEGKSPEFKFTKDTFTLTFDGKGSFKGTFKIDSAKNPKEIDLTVTEAPKDRFKGKTSRGIYELGKDSFKWCGNEPGSDERPKAFPEKEGQGKFLYLTFKRTK